MAASTTQHQIRPAIRLQFVAKERCNTTNGAGSIGMADDSLVTEASWTDITSIDARLTALDGTAYSAANLLSMTQNDKVYALRVADASTETGAIL